MVPELYLHPCNLLEYSNPPSQKTASSVLLAIHIVSNILHRSGDTQKWCRLQPCRQSRRGVRYIIPLKAAILSQSRYIGAGSLIVYLSGLNILQLAVIKGDSNIVSWLTWWIMVSNIAPLSA